jgi:hypothetical protein
VTSAFAVAGAIGLEAALWLTRAVVGL